MHLELRIAWAGIDRCSPLKHGLASSIPCLCVWREGSFTQSESLSISQLTALGDEIERKPTDRATAAPGCAPNVDGLLSFFVATVPTRTNTVPTLPRLTTLPISLSSLYDFSFWPWLLLIKLLNSIF